MQEETSRATTVATANASRALDPVAPAAITGTVAIAADGATAATDCARTGRGLSRRRSSPGTRDGRARPATARSHPATSVRVPAPPPEGLIVATGDRPANARRVSVVLTRLGKWAEKVSRSFPAAWRRLPRWLAFPPPAARTRSVPPANGGKWHEQVSFARCPANESPRDPARGDSVAILPYPHETANPLAPLAPEEIVAPRRW